MNLRLLPVLKFSAIGLASLLLLLSLLSANFYDPTLFHQLYPAEGIANWCGVLGALIGGTLIELFGAAAFLIPWCVLKLAYSSQSAVRRLCMGYYTFVMLLFSSTAHALWFPADFGNFADASFLQFPGYMGMLGSLWVLKFFSPLGASLFLGSILLFCMFKLFEEFPKKLFFSSLLYLGVLLPLYLAQKIWQNILVLSQWSKARLSHLKKGSPSNAEDASSQENPRAQSPSPAKNPKQSLHDKPRRRPKLLHERAYGWNDRVRH